MKHAILAFVALMAATVAGAQQKAAPRVPLRNLDEMIEMARTDLATRLGGKPTEVTLAGWKAVQLPARVLRCEVEKGDAGEPVVAGYQMVLVYKARDYTYYSDTKAVAACPRISAD
jgi:hypothetical protein